MPTQIRADKWMSTSYSMFSSVTQLFPSLCDPMDCSMLDFPVSLKPRTCMNSCPSSQFCHPTIRYSIHPFSSCLQFFPASESFHKSQFFASCGQSIGSFSFSISPSNEHSGLISYRMDWLDLLAEKTLKSLLLHHSSKASILHMKWPKYWSFSISPSDAYSGLI